MAAEIKIFMPLNSPDFEVYLTRFESSKSALSIFHLMSAWMPTVRYRDLGTNLGTGAKKY
jgi:hypothetical protein